MQPRLIIEFDKATLNLTEFNRVKKAFESNYVKGYLSKKLPLLKIKRNEEIPEECIKELAEIIYHNCPVGNADDNWYTAIALFKKTKCITCDY